MSDESQEPTVDETAPDVEEQVAPAEDSSPEVPEESKAQKRINQLTWEKHEARREADELRQRLDNLERQQQAPPAPAEETASAPHPDDFETDADYRAAFDAHVEQKAKAIAERALQETRTQESAQAQAQSRQQSLQQYRDKVAQYAADHDDFVADVQSANVNMPDHVVDALLTSDKPGDVTHYLAKNPDHAIRIAEMAPVAAARELAKIELTMEPSPKPISNAPPLMGDVGDSTEPVDSEGLSDDISVEEWRRRRNAQVRK